MDGISKDINVNLQRLVIDFESLHLEYKDMKHQEGDQICEAMPYLDHTINDLVKLGVYKLIE